MTEDSRMPNFWWCPTHHLYRGGDQRPCADAVQLVPAPPTTEDPRISEIRAVLDEDAATRTRFQVDVSTSYGPRFLSRIRAIADREPPAPRVFLVGDTVPVGVWVMNDQQRVFRGTTSDWEPMFGPCVEIAALPSLEDWQAAVDRALVEREEAQR